VEHFFELEIHVEHDELLHDIESINLKTIESQGYSCTLQLLELDVHHVRLYACAPSDLKPNRRF
jgi:hypothetical protein